jgi:acyl carrier protein
MTKTNKPSDIPSEGIAAPSRVTAREIEDWLIAHIADMRQLEHHQVDPRRPFVEFGLDSLAAMILMGDLEQWLGRELPPTLAWSYPSIETLARNLASDDQG